MQNKTKRVIAATFLLVVGAFIFIVGFSQQNTDKQAEIDNWKRVRTSQASGSAEGHVTEVTRQSETVRSGKARRIVVTYCPEYTFLVSGKNYTARAVGDDCKGARADIPEDASATIAYDTSNPAIAFVKSDATDAYYKDSDGSVIFAAVLGGVLFVSGALALVVTLRGKKA